MPGQKREARLRARCPGYPTFFAGRKAWMAGRAAAGGTRLAFRACAPPLSSSCAAAKKLHTPDMPGSFWSSQPCLPRPCLPRPRAAPIAPSDILQSSSLAEDARLRNDIRLLGRILGDTVRDQEGADVFDLVERIRQTSIRFHRDEDRPARRELETILDSMSISRDRAHRPRLQLFLAPRQHRRGPEQHPPDAGARRRWRAAGQHAGPDPIRMPAQPGSAPADLRRFFKGALVSPVLTAHPTEVRRKSTMDREMEIAALLDRRERVQLTPEEIEAATSNCAARC